MICPHCSHVSHLQSVRCPACHGAFDPLAFEEYSQLDYLKRRIAAWREDGTLPDDAAAIVLGRTDWEMTALRERITGTAPREPAAAPDAPRTASPFRDLRHAVIRNSPVPGPTPVAAPPPAAPPSRSLPSPTADPGPSAFRAWLHRGGQQIMSDIALHGLLYFGVLLTFVGMLGFSLFAFDSVNVGLRPVSELLAPALLFAAAWLVGRRRLRAVSGSLELLAGAIALVALFTSLNDGAPIPPDLHGRWLGLGWAASSLILAFAFRFATRQRRDSSLNLLIAPSIWAASWALGYAAAGGISVWQYPALALAIALTIAVAARQPQSALSRATRWTAPMGLVAAYLLCLIFAYRSGWPALPVAMTALAVLGGTALSGFPFRRDGSLPFAQSLLVATALPALAPDWGVATTGLVATLAGIALLEWHQSRGSSTPAVAFDLCIGSTGLLLALTQSGVGVYAWGVAALWLHVRTFWLRPLQAVDHSLGAFVCSVLPLVFAYELRQSVDRGLAWFLMASLLLTAATLTRVLKDQRRSRFYSAALPIAAAGIVLATAVERAVLGLPPSLTVATSVVAILPVFALVNGPTWPRLWASLVAVCWALEIGLDCVAAGVAARALIWASLGSLSVLLAVWTSRRFRPHLLLAGYLAGALGLWLAPSSNLRTATLSLWVLSTLTGVVAQETALTSLAGLTSTPRWLRWILKQAPLVALLISIPFWILNLGDLFAVFERRSLAGVAMSATAFCYAVAARHLRSRRPLAPIAATAAVTLSAIGVSVAAPVLVPSTIAVAIAIGAIAVLGGSLRQPYMSWLGWALSAALLMLLARVGGVLTGDLPKVLLGWACLCLIGGLGVDDVLAGRRGAGEALRRDWLLKPVALGALALPVALSFLFTAPAWVLGWWALAAAVAYLLIAWQLRAGAITFAAWSLASLSATVLLPWNAWQQPVWWLPQLALLLLVAVLLSRNSARSARWMRWDLGPLGAAHLVAAVALSRSFSLGTISLTWSGIGALALLLGARKRHPAWLIAGTALILAGSSQAGPGWLALALACLTFALVAVGLLASTPFGDVAQQTSALTTGAAWYEMLIWTGWPLPRQLDATLVAIGVAAFGSALAVRIRPAARFWLPGWTLLAAGGLAASIEIGLGSRPHWSLAFALAALAIASFLVAPRVSARLRDAGAGLLFCAGAAAAATLALSLSAILWVAIVPGLLAVVAIAASTLSRRLPAWRSALATYAALQTLAASALALMLLPDRAGLIALFAVLAVEATVLGLTLRRTVLLVCTPPLLCAAWIAFATRSAGGGDPQWITVPIGLAILAVLEIARYRPAGGESAPVQREIITALEIAGLSFVCGGALVESVLIGVFYAFMLVVWGLAIAFWALLTRVRRRLVAGSGVASLGLALLIVVPLVKFAPNITGAALWAALAGLGALFLLVATTLEQSRAQVGTALRRLTELTEAWE